MVGNVNDMNAMHTSNGEDRRGNASPAPRRLGIAGRATAGSGDRRALAWRLEEHRTALTRLCRSIVGDADAEDAVQETMIRAWRALERFEGRSSLSTWLHRIARNVCMDVMETRQRRTAQAPLELDHLSSDDAAAAVWMSAPEPDPVDRALDREATREAVAFALQHLPRRQRVSLILCEVLGFRASEAAGMLGTTVASVTSSLQRARVTLARIRAGGGDVHTLHDEAALLYTRYVRAFARDDIGALVSIAVEESTPERSDGTNACDPVACVR